MSDALLTTKLYFPPPRPSLVSRPRLIDRLQAGLQFPLTLISAQAGAGKTTILSQWRLGPGSTLPVAWLSLDSTDNDPRRFLQYLTAALDGLQPGLEVEVRPLLQSTEQTSGEAVLTLLINRLSSLEKEAVLVLDDLHLIDNPDIHTDLTFLLDHLPPHLHLAILSRADPPLPLSRLRARGQLVEIRSADLRFSVEEAAEFLNQVMDLDLTGDQVAALEKRTEGWIAGLQLAALSMHKRKDVDDFVSAFTGSNHYIVDYLVEEVLARQPEPLRQFLLKTSILDRLTGSLCDALTGKENGEAVLDELNRDNLFLIPLDDERHWYRYHHLFADLLRLNLKHSHPDMERDLHQRASLWYEAQNLLSEAITHALKGDDADRAARLLEANVMVMIERGHLGTLLEWLDALPPDQVRGRAWLSIARAWALAYTAAYDDATECLVDAAQALEGQAGSALSPEEADHVRGHIYAIRCYMLGAANLGNPDESVGLALKALDLLPANDGRARGLVSVLLGVCYRQKMDYSSARESLERALEIARSEDQEYVIIDLLCQLALVERDQGKFHRAEATCREVLRLVDEYGNAPPVCGYALCALSDIFYEWNDLSSASAYARKALDLAKQWGSTDLINGALYSTAMPLIASRQFDHAMKVLEELRQLYIPTGHYPRLPVAMEASVRVHMGDLARADQCAADLDSQTSVEWRMQHLIPVYIALFRAGLRSSLDDVMGFISQYLLLYESTDCPGGRVFALCCQAMALEALGQKAKAGATLRHALSIAEPEGYVRLFIDHGASMESLLSSVRASDRNLHNAAARSREVYVSRLLKVFEAETPGTKSETSASPKLVEPLSGRELEVLKLLAQGCSDKQIATSLIIARETVHKHLKNIYGKLGVHNRTEAAARARELGLL